MSSTDNAISPSYDSLVQNPAVAVTEKSSRLEAAFSTRSHGGACSVKSRSASLSPDFAPTSKSIVSSSIPQVITGAHHSTCSTQYASLCSHNDSRSCRNSRLWDQKLLHFDVLVMNPSHRYTRSSIALGDSTVHMLSLAYKMEGNANSKTKKPKRRRAAPDNRP